MNRDQIYRWLCQPFSLVIQQLMWVFYPIAVLLYKLKVKNKTDIPIMSELEIQKYPVKWDLEQLKTAEDELRDELFLNDDDNHTAIVHAHMWQAEQHRDKAHKALELLVRKDGALKRRYPVDTEWYPVSGDCLSSWVFSAVITGYKNEEVIQRVAKHYLKSVFGMQHFNRKVSARCSNGGINLVFDGWPVNKKWWPFSYGMIQPAAGPQFFTSMAILELAASVGSKPKRLMWKAISKLHYLIYQGALFVRWPILHLKNDLLYYTQHVTMLNLFSINKLTGSKSVIGTMKHIAKELSPHGNINPFFYALINDCEPINETKKHKALEILKRMPSWNGFIWQEIPNEHNYFIKERPNKHHNHVGGFVARLLK